MVDTKQSSGDVVAAVTPKMKKNVVKKPTHPKTSEMVNNAIKDLKERGGSSLQAIKKYIAAYYKVDAEKLAPFVKKYLKSAVTSGALVQTKGKGASGSFKLAVVKKDPSSAAAKKLKIKRTSPEKSVKKSPAAKTSTAAKKLITTAKSTKPAAKKAVKKIPSKAKKTTKVPTKPKTPKAKKVVAVRGAKKLASKK